jgi:type IV pilus assembly protein PilV
MAADRTGMRRPRPREAGFSLLEILITLLILTIGLLGLAGLQAIAQRTGQEAYQRAQAIIILNDILDRINTNRAVATCYAITTPASGTPHLGTTGTGRYDPAGFSCPSMATNPNGVTRAGVDLAAIDAVLQGAAESASGARAGAMIGARACIGYDSTTSSYSVAVAWQGLGSTFSPASWDTTTTPATARNCAINKYGTDDALRRVVWSTLLVATLN